MHDAQADMVLHELPAATAAPNSLQQGSYIRNGYNAFGAAAQQTAQKQVPQGSATHSSRTQSSKAVTVSSEASAIDITGEESEAASGHTSASPGLHQKVRSPDFRSTGVHASMSNQKPAVSPFAKYSSELPVSALPLGSVPARLLHSPQQQPRLLQPQQVQAQVHKPQAQQLQSLGQQQQLQLQQKQLSQERLSVASVSGLVAKPPQQQLSPIPQAEPPSIASYQRQLQEQQLQRQQQAPQQQQSGAVHNLHSDVQRAQQQATSAPQHLHASSPHLQRPPTSAPLQMTLQAPTLAAQHDQHGAQHAQRITQQPSPESQKPQLMPRYPQAQDIFQHSQHLQSQQMQQQQQRLVQAQLQQGLTVSQQQNQQPQHERPGVAASTAPGSQGQPTQSRAVHHVLNLQAKLNMRPQGQAPAQAQQLPGKLLSQAAGPMPGHTSAPGQASGQTVAPGQRSGQSLALGQAPGQMQTHPIGYGPNKVQQQLPHNQGLPNSAAALPLSQTLHSPALGGLSPRQLPLQTQRAGQLQQSPIQPQHGAAGAIPRTPPPGHGLQDEQVHLVWKGWLLVDSSVIQRPEAGKILQGVMAANKATWPVGLETGWHQPLVVSKLVPIPDMKALLGQDMLERAPQLSLRVQTLGDAGKECIGKMLMKNSMGMVKIPVTGKFLGLVVIAARSTTAQGHMSPKVFGYVLPLPRSNQHNPTQHLQPTSA